MDKTLRKALDRVKANYPRRNPPEAGRGAEQVDALGKTLNEMGKDIADLDEGDIVAALEECGIDGDDMGTATESLASWTE